MLHALTPATAKALLCQHISEILGVRICRLVKFTGKEPTFHMELEESKIEFASVGKLISAGGRTAGHRRTDRETDPEAQAQGLGAIGSSLGSRAQAPRKN